MILPISSPPTSEQIAVIAEALVRGGVVLMPSDTIYGLHAVATDEAAVGRIVAMKGRDGVKPLVVLGDSIAQIEKLGVAIGLDTRTMLESLWPAPLTAILPLREPIAASRGATSLAVRIPAPAWLHALIEATGPIVSTSANRSGETPIRSVEEAAPQWLDALDIVADAGPVEGEVSAIVDFTGAEPRLIRDGERLFTQKVWKTLRKTL